MLNSTLRLKSLWPPASELVINISQNFFIPHRTAHHNPLKEKIPHRTLPHNILFHPHPHRTRTPPHISWILPPHEKWGFLEQKFIRLTENLQNVQNYSKIAHKLSKLDINCCWKIFKSQYHSGNFKIAWEKWLKIAFLMEKRLKKRCGCGTHFFDVPHRTPPAHRNTQNSRTAPHIRTYGRVRTCAHVRKCWSLLWML